MILLLMILVVLASMALVLLRCLKGPTAYDRLLAANVFGTMTVVLIALLSLEAGNMAYIDIALLYALINFITTVAFLRYFRDGSFKSEE